VEDDAERAQSRGLLLQILAPWYPYGMEKDATSLRLGETDTNAGLKRWGVG
jgi:hypothetical protein